MQSFIVVEVLDQFESASVGFAFIGDMSHQLGKPIDNSV